MKKSAGAVCAFALIALHSTRASAETTSDEARAYAAWAANMRHERCVRRTFPADVPGVIDSRPWVLPCLELRQPTADETRPTPPADVPDPPPAKPPREPVRNAPLNIGTVAPLGSYTLADNTVRLIKLVGVAVLATEFGDHVSVEKDWRTLQDVLHVRADIGRLHPFVEASFLVLDPRKTPTFSPDANPIPKDSRHPADEYYVNGDKAAYYFVGASYDLGKGYAVRAGGTVLRTDITFYAAQAGFIIPLGPLP